MEIVQLGRLSHQGYWGVFAAEMDLASIIQTFRDPSFLAEA